MNEHLPAPKIMIIRQSNAKFNFLSICAVKKPDSSKNRFTSKIMKISSKNQFSGFQKNLARHFSRDSAVSEFGGRLF